MDSIFSFNSSHLDINFTSLTCPRPSLQSPQVIEAIQRPVDADRPSFRCIAIFLRPLFPEENGIIRQSPSRRSPLVDISDRKASPKSDLLPGWCLGPA